MLWIQLEWIFLQFLVVSQTRNHVIKYVKIPLSAVDAQTWIQKSSVTCHIVNLKFLLTVPVHYDLNIQMRLQLLHLSSTAILGTEASGRRWTKSGTVIGYCVGKMVISCLFRITCCIPQENIALFPYNKSFIDQACLVKMSSYWLCSFLPVYRCTKKYLANI